MHFTRRALLGFIICYSANRWPNRFADERERIAVQPSVRLQEERRTSRRTVADAHDVVRQVFGIDEIPHAQIQLGPLRLPSEKLTALVDIVFVDLGCRVSLPTSAQFKALTDADSQRQVFEIFLLAQAEVCSDGSVVLSDGTRLRAVEVLPTLLPYEPSRLEESILRHVISLTNSDNCYRAWLEGVPRDLQDQCEQLFRDARRLDYSRVREIQAPLLKIIQGHIQDNDPQLNVSNQKIADALATFGVRVPRHRPRAVITACCECRGIATIRLGSETLTLRVV